MASPFLRFWEIPYFEGNSVGVFRGSFYESAVSLQYLRNKFYHHPGGCQGRGPKKRDEEQGDVRDQAPRVLKRSFPQTGDRKREIPHSYKDHE
jgi:hypothetical protein